MQAELHGRQEIVNHSSKSSFIVYNNDQVESYPPHWHTDIEIIMPIENCYTVVLRDTTYILNPGDIMIIPSGELHELSAPDSGNRYIVQLDRGILREVNGFDSIYSKFFPCAIFRQSEAAEGHDVLKSLLHNIVVENTRQLPMYEASIHAFILSFFIQAGRIQFSQIETLNDIKTEKQQYYIDVFYNLCSYMNDHCTEDLTVDELATMTGFSTSHFIRLFKKFTGVTYYEYLINRKINYAEMLLMDRMDLNISEVAMRSGFNSLATFNRVFKQNLNCTPTEYRNAYLS
ncbi:MAG: helix-turn-helix transcriptional regulator [Pseudobutyrivibrio sp.]|nr:helix-turn-helix transcriptional regulator [Pseudobutyrivibrio sp.]